MYSYFKNLFDEVSKIMKDDFEETVKECEDCEGKSYYHMVSDKYEDGKHVSHKEKEIKDGKVVKDIDNCMNIEDKCEENKKCCKKESCNAEEIQRLKKEIETLTSSVEYYRNKSLDAHKLMKENAALKRKLEKIQSIFE